MRVFHYNNFPYLPPFYGSVERPTPKRFWKKSVYYWWWEYLRRNDTYGPGHNLYEDFGDVSGGFVEWWVAKGDYLFAEPIEKYPYKRVTEPLPEEVYSDPNVMIVQVPLDQPVSELKKRFARDLNIFTLTDPQQGIRAARSSQARYRVDSGRAANVMALEKTLAVYDCRLANPDMTLWQIWLTLNPDLSEEKDPDKMVWAATVSRYLKKAKAMIKNTGDGRFPDLS